MQETVSKVEDLSFGEAVGWVAMGSDVDHGIRRLKVCARVNIR